MIRKKRYRIHRWRCWDDELFLSTHSFFSKYGVYPHIFLANSTTLKRIEQIALTIGFENIKDVETGERLKPDQIDLESCWTGRIQYKRLFACILPE